MRRHQADHLMAVEAVGTVWRTEPAEVARAGKGARSSVATRRWIKELSPRSPVRRMQSNPSRIMSSGWCASPICRRMPGYICRKPGRAGSRKCRAWVPWTSMRIKPDGLAPAKAPPEFWSEVQPPASRKGLDLPSRRAVFVPWKPSRRPAFGMGNPTFC
jgi:hypothetical protein